MRKLKLKLDELSVESFVLGGEGGVGTVRARSVVYDDPTVEGDTCYQTCQCGISGDCIWSVNYCPSGGAPSCGVTFCDSCGCQPSQIVSQCDNHCTDPYGSECC